MSETNSNISFGVEPGNESTVFRVNNLIILLGTALVVLSLLGINIIEFFGRQIQKLIDIIILFVTQILSIMGYTAGSVLNTSADIVSDTTKLGIDIADDTVHSAGDILKEVSRPNVDEKAKGKLDHMEKFSQYKREPFGPDGTTDPIQNPITSAKTKWCLVGEFDGKRGCVDIGDQDKCMSGQVFPEQKMCLNPTMSKNM